VRRAVAAVLLVLAAVLPAVAVASWWAYGTATDTDRFMEAAQPLVTDRTVQRQVVDELVAAADARLAAPAGQIPGGTAAARAQVGAIAERLVATRAYRQRWLATMRSTHARLAARLTGDYAAPLTLDLGPVAGVLRARVAAAGLRDVADAIPDPAPVVLLDRAEVRRAHDAANATRIVRAFSLPGAVVALLGVLLTAPGLASGLLRVGVCLAVSTVLLAVGWLVARDAIPVSATAGDLGVAVYDVLTRPLRGWVIGGAIAAAVPAAAGGGLRYAQRD
jgi:hypothetical protein